MSKAEYPNVIEVNIIFHEGQKMFAVPVQPAQRTPLTDEQISAASKGHMTRNGFARAIEAAHGIKEKNT